MDNAKELVVSCRIACHGDFFGIHHAKLLRDDDRKDSYSVQSYSDYSDENFMERNESCGGSSLFRRGHDPSPSSPYVQVVPPPIFYAQNSGSEAEPQVQRHIISSVHYFLYFRANCQKSLGAEERPTPVLLIAASAYSGMTANTTYTTKRKAYDVLRSDSYLRCLPLSTAIEAFPWQLHAISMASGNLADATFQLTKYSSQQIGEQNALMNAKRAHNWGPCLCRGAYIRTGSTSQPGIIPVDVLLLPVYRFLVCTSSQKGLYFALLRANLAHLVPSTGSGVHPATLPRRTGSKSSGHSLSMSRLGRLISI